MHGQKKRRKRTVEGNVEIDDISMTWTLVSEPQWSNSGGYKGMCVSVRVADQVSRELILEYPYPTDKSGRKLPVPQRPPLVQSDVEVAVRQAIQEGWDPDSRGKAFMFRPPA